MRQKGDGEWDKDGAIRYHIALRWFIRDDTVMTHVGSWEGPLRVIHGTEATSIRRWVAERST